MASAIRTIGHEDRLSLVDHLEELRTRLIVSAAVLVVAFGICLWQNHALLRVLNKPLQAETKKQVAKGEGTVGQAVLAQRGLLNLAASTQAALGVLAKPGSGLSAHARAAAHAAARHPEGGRRARAPQSGGRQSGDARHRRTVHDDGHGDAVLRADRLAAGDPVRALRLHPARDGAARAPRGDAAAHRRPVPVRGRRGVRVLRRAAGRGALLRELQLQRVQHARPGEPLLQLRSDRAAGDGSRASRSRW